MKAFGIMGLQEGGDSIEGFGDLKSRPCRAWEGQEGGKGMLECVDPVRYGERTARIKPK